MLRYRIKVISIIVLVMIVYFAILNYAGVHGTRTTFIIVERDWILVVLPLTCAIIYSIMNADFKGNNRK